ncbi:MAG: DUF99 family protein [Persicimonas sp.]
MSLERILRKGKTLRAIGFDDAPFTRGTGEPVHVAGVVCADTKFEGMVWGEVVEDGWDATDVVGELLLDGKFLPQLHLLLLDGIALAGFNVVDLPELHRRLGLPCVAVMRTYPDLDAVELALRQLPEPERRLELIGRAGPIHRADNVCFQVAGAPAELIPEALERLTYTGHIPEPLRMAHLIGAAVETGESGRRA